MGCLSCLFLMRWNLGTTCGASNQNKVPPCFMGVSAPMTMSRSSEGELNLVGRFRSRSESRDQKTLPRNVIVACF